MPRGLLTLCPWASSGPQGLYTAYIQPIYSLFTAYILPVYSLYAGLRSPLDCLLPRARGACAAWRAWSTAGVRHDSTAAVTRMHTQLRTTKTALAQCNVALEAAVKERDRLAHLEQVCLPPSLYACTCTETRQGMRCMCPCSVARYHL